MARSRAFAGEVATLRRALLDHQVLFFPEQHLSPAEAALDGLHAVHRSWWEPVQESVHPVVREHPETGPRCCS